eukprot:TRINITY_DN45342_c0_g1_i1.p1 TRINITY_DN45342_c0_g1~~TRINITY_DN45342_c0_g1_i1.p1  ORF type:complete len:239 (-),score=39.70 TRINITY_DN45342_c0_g1_i1:94-810(-)
MFQSCIPHHDVGGFKSHRTFLPDAQYGVALDNVVKGCSDMLLISPDGSKIFLGKRIVHPQPDWWFVGGRIFPGETAIASCRRLLNRELSLDVEPSRFRTVCVQSLAWHMRQQEPKGNGTTDAQVVLSFQLRDDEVEKVVLDPKEYSESDWKSPNEILEGNFHPALKFAVHSLLTNRKLDDLKQAVATGEDDHEVAKFAKDFISMTQKGDSLLQEGPSDYLLENKELCYETTVEVKLGH